MFRQHLRLLWNFGRHCRQILHSGNMYNQRIVRWAAFGCVNLGCRFFIQRIGPKTIYGLCGKCHKASFFQNLPCFFDAARF